MLLIIYIKCKISFLSVEAYHLINALITQCAPKDLLHTVMKSKRKPIPLVVWLSNY